MMKKHFCLILILIPCIGLAQFEPNYDESKVPDYELPDVLTSFDGKKITNINEWEEIRRPEILEIFEAEVYGKVPDRAVKVSFEIIDDTEGALDGRARRKQVKIHFSNGSDELEAFLLIYLPGEAVKQVPVFLGYNFYGNHTIHPDPEIILDKSWVRNNPAGNIFNNQSGELSRGMRTNRWPVSYILARGYGIAVMYYGNIDPDFDDGFQNGIHPLYYKEGQSQPSYEEWGSISAWAYGLSQAMNYFEKDNMIDHTKVAVMGHSRLGKTSLWAGAVDERFALVISNESGCGGAALSRRRFGETVERINTSFPYWFADNFIKYNNNEDSLPVDQHMLIALMAPRPVYIASAQGDPWADPKGEFLSGFHASPVYALYDLEGLTKKEMPPVNQPDLSGHIGYHIRSGEHDQTYYDWDQFINFADKYFK